MLRLAVTAALLPAALAAQGPISFQDEKVTITSSDAAIETYQGREAVRLKSGSVIVNDAAFEHGTIEFDVATTGHRSFVGVAFRISDDQTRYDHFYIRPHQTGRFDAVQYTPSFNGLSAWQLYPEYNASVDIPPDEWIHIKLVIAGSRLEAFVGDMGEPAIVVEEMKTGPGSGSVALTSGFPGAATADFYPTAFANLVITPANAAGRYADGENTPPDPSSGIISRWSLSRAFALEALPLMELRPELLGAQEWRTVTTDSTGRINLAQFNGIPDSASEGTVLAKVVIESDRDQIKMLNFGMSDRGSVFLNGGLLLECLT